MRIALTIGLAAWSLLATVVSAAAEDRAFQSRLAASIEPPRGDGSGDHDDLLTDALPTEDVAFPGECVGRSHAQVRLHYTKLADDAILVSGGVDLLVGRHCLPTDRIFDHVDLPADTRIEPNGEFTLPLDLRGPGLIHLTGSLVLKNVLPSCTGTHVRWRAHMALVDYESLLWNSDRHAEFDSAQISMFLEPVADGSRVVSMKREIADETSARVEAKITVTPQHSATVETVLDFFETGNLWEAFSSSLDDTERNVTEIPPASERVVHMRASDAGSVDVDVTMENHGGATTCGTGLPTATASAPWFLPPPFLFPTPAGPCTPMIQGCYMQLGDNGWIRFDEVACAASRCTLRGEGSYLVCPHERRWPFVADVDPDCLGARFMLKCAGTEPIVFRRGPKATTIQRGTRMFLLQAGSACR